MYVGLSLFVFTLWYVDALRQVLNARTSADSHDGNQLRGWIRVVRSDPHHTQIYGANVRTLPVGRMHLRSGNYNDLRVWTLFLVLLRSHSPSIKITSPRLLGQTLDFMGRVEFLGKARHTTR